MPVIRNLFRVPIYFLILNSVFLQIRGFCQNYSSPINKKIDTLNRKGIDTILRYSYEFTGLGLWKDSLYLFDAEYLIWHEESGNYIQKFSFCCAGDCARAFDTAFSQVLVKDQLPLQYFTANIENLKNQHLRPALFKLKIDGNDTTFLQSRGPHSATPGITFYIRKEEFKNHYFDEQVWNGTIYNDDGSIRYKLDALNYEYNTSTAVVKLVHLLDSSIRILELSLIHI